MIRDFRFEFPSGSGIFFYIIFVRAKLEEIPYDQSESDQCILTWKKPLYFHDSLRITTEISLIISYIIRINIQKSFYYNTV